LNNNNLYNTQHKQQTTPTSSSSSREYKYKMGWGGEKEGH